MNSALLDPNTLACTRHAAERAGRSFCIELGRDARNLRAIAWTAPLLGMLGTVVLLKLALREYALPGFGMCDCAGGVAETFVPIALSLPLSVFASVGSQ